MLIVMILTLIYQLISTMISMIISLILQHYDLDQDELASGQHEDQLSYV